MLSNMVKQKRKEKAVSDLVVFDLVVFVWWYHQIRDLLKSCQGNPMSVDILVVSDFVSL